MAQTKRCYYEVLQVTRTVEFEEIKKSYRKLAVKHHPDKNPGDTTAEGRFRELAEAYDILSDAEKRAAYDRYGHSAFQGGMGGGGGIAMSEGSGGAAGMWIIGLLGLVGSGGGGGISARRKKSSGRFPIPVNHTYLPALSDGDTGAPGGAGGAWDGLIVGGGGGSPAGLAWGINDRFRMHA